MVNIVIAALNIAGLLLDISGVILLFYLRDQSLKEVFYRLPKTTSTMHAESEKRYVQEDAERLRKQINDNISQTERNNKRILRQSSKVLWLIIAGFALQFAANSLAMVVAIA